MEAFDRFETQFVNYRYLVEREQGVINVKFYEQNLDVTFIENDIGVTMDVTFPLVFDHGDDEETQEAWINEQKDLLVALQLFTNVVGEVPNYYFGGCFGCPFDEIIIGYREWTVDLNRLQVIVDEFARTITQGTNYDELLFKGYANFPDEAKKLPEIMPIIGECHLDDSIFQGTLFD